jgi:hypothetical protein
MLVLQTLAIQGMVAFLAQALLLGTPLHLRLGLLGMMALQDKEQQH